MMWSTQRPHAYFATPGKPVAVEGRHDLDTYYAHTPLIREMIVLYLAAHLISDIVSTVLCVRWAREVGE
ncbi:hypothetical protein [Streptomyces sp. NPDC051098]|uniref:hypothetical protein n=1 Tax=Streptomyces sp. NPDC051098 TaxID=3155411 RepID=UPI003427CEDB